MFGTVLFGVWEGWQMDTAAYYCFITISTIGFGDVVPNLTKTENDYKLIAVCVLAFCSSGASKPFGWLVC